MNSQCFHSAAIVAYRITDGKHRKFRAQVLDTEIAPPAIRGITFSPRLPSWPMIQGSSEHIGIDQDIKFGKTDID